MMRFAGPRLAYLRATIYGETMFSRRGKMTESREVSLFLALVSIRLFPFMPAWFVKKKEKLDLFDPRFP